MAGTEMHLDRIQVKTIPGADNTPEIIRKISSEGSQGASGDLSVIVYSNGSLFAGVGRYGSYITNRCDDAIDRQSSRSRIGAFLKYIVPVKPGADVLRSGSAALAKRPVGGGVRQGYSRYKKKKQGLSPESRQEFFHNERGEWSTNFLPMLQ